jgi:hypothetical protein
VCLKQNSQSKRIDVFGETKMTTVMYWLEKEIKYALNGKRCRLKLNQASYSGE